MSVKIDPAMEAFFAENKQFVKLVKAAKKVTKEEFEKQAKPGDIVICYVDRKKLSKFKRLTSGITTWAQGASFSSCKMIVNNNRVCGYDCIGRGLELNDYLIKTFLRNKAGVMLIRHKELTPEQAQFIVSWMKKREKMKVPYSMYALLISALRHFFKVFRTKDSEPSRKDLMDYREPMFCSTIVQRAFDACGVETGLGKDVGKSYIWPVDYLLSDKFETVCGYFMPGELDGL